MRKLKKYTPTRFIAKTSHYDKDAADFAVMFIESLSHTKGTWAGKLRYCLLFGKRKTAKADF